MLELLENSKVSLPGPVKDPDYLECFSVYKN